MMVRDRFHGAWAARTLEGVTTPDFENEIAPEGAHVASPTFGGAGMLLRSMSSGAQVRRIWAGGVFSGANIISLAP